LHGCLYHAGTFGPAVDEVAQKDHRRLRRPCAAIVVFDRDNQFVEQVSAPVNVADDVVALALGHFRQNLCRFAFAEQSGEFDHGENRWFSAGS